MNIRIVAQYILSYLVFNLGGAAGPVVAARLSEIADWKVLLVEAGPDEPPGTQVPSNLQLYLSNASLHSRISRDL